MKSKLQLIVRLVLAVSLAPLLSRAQATSRVIPFSNIATTLPPCAAPPDPACPKPVNVTVQLWQDATSVAPADLIFSEAQPSASLDDAGNVSFVFGSQTAGGLNPDHFPSGSSRFLDVVDPAPPGLSFLAARVPLNATPFALSPGPAGPQGPPGVVQTVTAADASVAVGGTPADRNVAVAANGITNAKVANGALSPAKITGTAATLGPNTFSGDQTFNGSGNFSGNTTTALVNVTQSGTGTGLFVASPNGVGVDAISLVGVRGSTGVGGFGIVGSAPAGGTAGQFNGNVNVVGPLSVSAGNLTMVDSTATAGSILKGNVPFIHNFGTQNTFIGKNAGNLAMSGGNNTASGFNALFNNTTGTSNTASGVNALLGNNTGNFNTASGARALEANTTGNQNTANGAGALFSNTTGGFNTASGANALQANTTGFDNTAVGTEALFSNIGGGVPGLPAGISNTAVGRSALRANTTGNDNTAVGTEALFSNTADGLLTGHENTAVGRSALRANTTGVGNIASGFFALLSNTTGNSNTAVGRSALQNNTTGGGNTASGLDALLNTTGDNNTASGAGAFANNTTGNGNTAIGANADVLQGNLTNATAIGFGAKVGFSNKIRLGNTAVTVVEGQVPFTFTSDKNQKENFQPVEGEQVLRKVGGLSLTSWNYIGHDPKQFRHYGPVAQDFFAAFGHDAVGTIGTDTTINSGDMEGILMIAVQALEKRSQDQSKRIDALLAENADLKGRLKDTVEASKTDNARLKARLEKLERSIGSYVLAAKAE